VQLKFTLAYHLLTALLVFCLAIVHPFTVLHYLTVVDRLTHLPLLRNLCLPLLQLWHKVVLVELLLHALESRADVEDAFLLGSVELLFCLYVLATLQFTLLELIDFCFVCAALFLCFKSLACLFLGCEISESLLLCLSLCLFTSLALQLLFM
jgi:hypothetical protein